MSMSDNDPLGESHPPQRPSAADRNGALSRVDLPLMESIAPPDEERNSPSNSSTAAGGTGEASARGVARGDGYPMPADLPEAGRDSGGGSCLARGGVMSAAAADRAAPTHRAAASSGTDGRGGGGRGHGDGAEEPGRIGSPQATPDGSSSAGLVPAPLAAHSLVASTTTASSALADSGGAPLSFRTRSGTHFSERAGGPRMSRSISSRSRRAASMSSSIRPLLPSTRGLGLETLVPRTFSARAASGNSRLALPSSPSGTPGVGSADTYSGRNVSRGSSLALHQQQQQQQQQHPLAGYPLRIPARHAGSAGRAEGGRPSVHRLASGGREPWRAPAAAYTAAERRTGRDTTALRAVSARLDAAATAIDAVEIGVRSASDSLDSLLQLLESRPGSGATPGAANSSRSSSGSSNSSSINSGGGGGEETSSSEEASSSTSRSVPGGSSDDLAASSSSAVADREAAPFISSRGAEAGGGLRAANMLRRELTVGSTPPAADHAQTEGQASADGQSRAMAVSHSTSRGAASSAVEDPVAARDALIGEANAELGGPASLGGRSAPVCATPRLAPASSTSVEEGAGRGHHGVGASERAAVGSAPATGGRGEDGGSHPQPRLSQSSESRRPSLRGVGETGNNTTSSVAEAETATNRGNRDSSLPLLELEVAMSGIDAERGRLILEIARLRGQQNQSLVQLQRLQHEQFIVRQRQVSTLSDIVNSFGRTVEAAGALPHGEDSSLGRISNDVVSTLRRMLRLLSATVPSDAGAAAPGERPANATLAGLPPSTSATTAAAATATATAAAAAAGDDDTSRSSGTASPTGTYSVGGRVALRPTGGDLTQEVIDAALQALPRLAAAATAISGARRVQGYLAGLGDDGVPGAPEERRCCSKETIAALPDAPPCAARVVGGVSDGGGVRGCVICLSEDSTTEQPLCRLPCNHVFHRACVGKWLMMQDSCPTCRSQVPNVEIGPPAPAATTTPAVV